MPTVRRQRRRKPSTDRILIVAARVGFIGNAALPAGTATEACHECSAALWVTEFSRNVVRKSRYTPVYVCVLCNPERPRPVSPAV